MSNRIVSRRGFLQAGAGVLAATRLAGRAFAQAIPRPLEEVAYSQVRVTSEPHVRQRANTHSVLMGLNEDSLLKPFREMVGQDAPGESLGGWYEYLPDYDYRTGDAGLAPTATFGQWTSALCRAYDAATDSAVREKVLRLNGLYAQTIAPAYYEKNRFPAYCFDKLVCGLMDSHRLLGDPDAFKILNATADTAAPQLPGHAVDRDVAWRKDKDVSWNWDESYTIPENLFLVYRLGAGQRYFDMAEQYLDDRTYFDPLASGNNVLGGRHAYSYVNALCSAMQAYMVGGSEKHLRAAQNGFDMLEQQSFATGGWGPDEMLRKPGSGEVFASLTNSHNSFETPCGSYAHMKLTRYLLRVTRDGRYGDSMERVMYNTVLGAEPLQPDGHAFYYADYNLNGKRAYSDHRWPCCSGTLPQVAADYGINAYLREPGAVWVNLYIPSVLRWTEGNARMELEVGGDYPLSETITMRLKASTTTNMALHLRIPAWGKGAVLQVNRQTVPMQIERGFVTVSRLWRSGDQIELRLPMRLRLEAADAEHPETAALMRGPLVLFAELPGGGVRVDRGAALAARQSGHAEWSIATGIDPVRLRPFVKLGDTRYTTYLTLV
jgi:hypothetical protein